MVVPLERQKKMADAAVAVRTQISAASSAQGALADTAMQPAFGVYRIPSVASAASLTIPANVKVIVIEAFAPNYSNPNTMLGRANYIRVSTQPTHTGKVRTADRFSPSGVTDNVNGGWWELAEEIVTPEMFASITSGAALAQAVQLACDYLGTRWGGGAVKFGPRTYTIDVHPSRIIGTNEGTSVILTSTHNNIAFIGSEERTRIKPTSNKIEIFQQNGAQNLVFDGIIFDNSDNGLLQNTVKPGSYTPAGGVAGYGNLACCAIRQISGAGLAIRNCGFISFSCGVEYIGLLSDDQILSGVYDISNSWFDSCIQDNLVSQPRNLIMTMNRSVNRRDSINFDGSIDPGHYIYLTNRAGAYPDLVNIDGWQSRGSYSSSVKIRKGKEVVIANGTIYGDGRGIEIHNCDGGAVSNVTMLLANTTTDTGRNGVEVDDCGHVLINNVQIDIRGIEAWGFRIRKDLGDNTWQNRGVRVDNCRILVDYSPTGGKAPCIVADQVEPEIDLVVKHYGTVVPSRHPIHCQNVDNGRFHVLHLCPNGAADAHRLVQFDEFCTGNYVRARNAEMAANFVFGNGGSASVFDLGSGNTVDLMDYVAGTFMPTITFATTGPTSVDYSTPGVQFGEYRRYKDRVEGTLRVSFKMVKGTPVGNFIIDGLPVAAKNNGNAGYYAITAARFDNVTFDTGMLQLMPTVAINTTRIIIYGARTGVGASTVGPNSFVGTDNVTQYNIALQFSYPT